MEENKIIASAVCPQCGAPLIAVDEKGTLKCEYCNTVALDGRHSFTHVSRDFDSELDISLESAQTLIKNRFYEQAFSAYSELVNTFGKDHRVWEGLATAVTKNFTDYGVYSDVFIQAERFYNTACSTKGFSEDSEFAVEYKKWRAEVIVRNAKIQEYAHKCAVRRKITKIVMYASVPIFLLAYWFICRNAVSCTTYSSWIDEVLAYALAPAIYSTVMGIASIILKFRSVSLCLNVLTVGCTIIMLVSTWQIRNSFDLFWLVPTILLTLAVYLAATLIGRILGLIAVSRGY